MKTLKTCKQVLAHVSLPPGLRGAEVYGFCTAGCDGLEAYVHIDEVFALLRPGDSMVLTGAGHTTAMHRDSGGAVHAFDPLPASVALVADAPALAAALRAAHRGMLQFTATVLRTDTAERKRVRAE